MAKAIFNVFFKIINGVASVLLFPVNKLFNTVVNNYIGDGVAYFFTILPPNTRSVVLIYLALLVSYYTVSISLHAILKVYTIIKNIKFW